MTSTGAFLTFAFSLVVLFSSRRVAALAIVAGTLYITQGQAVDLGLNMLAIRFIEVAAGMRVLLRGEIQRIYFSSADAWLVSFPLITAIVYCLRVQNLDAYQVGLFVDAMLVYFSFRALVQDFDEFTSLAKGIVLLLVPFAILMAIEAQTGRNLFSLMGGVPETPLLRDGHYRCQASFRHAITAGSVGATFFPLYLGLVFAKRDRIWPWLGAAASTVIVIASYSSGPLMAFGVGITAWLCWPLRTRMAWVRRGIASMLVLLQLTMTAPVWFIFDRISGFIGGDGWHRSNLIDKFLRDFGEWAVAGMPIERTSSWAATQMPWGGVDVTNYYVSTGLNGGLFSLMLLLIFIILAFRLIGRASAILRRNGSRANELIIWGTGATFCAHVINLTAVIYWDQSYVIWYLHIAIAVSLSTYLTNPQSRASLIPKESSVPQEPILVHSTTC